MTREQFFKVLNPPPPQFILTKDLTVISYHWVPGHSAHEKPQRLTIRKGTRLESAGYSAFDNGYSMKIATKRTNYRWFQVPYSLMKAA